jgi:hypothetical protein
MTDLRLVGRTEDGSQLELTDGEGNTYFLRISDNLRGTINQPRLVAVAHPEDRVSFSVKEIQSRLRAGESIDSIARTTDWSHEKIDRFSGPIMQERAYIIGVALKTALRRDAGSPDLATATIAQLQPRGVDMTAVEWNTHRNDDGTWTIFLYYPNRDDNGEAQWIFDLDNRTLVADDDGARWISGDEKPGRPATPSHGMVYGGEESAPAPRLVAFSESVTIVESTPLSIVPDFIESGDEESDDGAPATLPIDVAPEAPADIPSDAKKDGVTKRIRIPSWDDIMFGSKSEEKDSDPQN